MIKKIKNNNSQMMDYKISIYKDYSYDLHITGETDNAFVKRALKVASKKKKVDLDRVTDYTDKIPLNSGSFFLIQRYLNKGTYQDIRNKVNKDYNLDFIDFRISSVYLERKDSDIWLVNINVVGNCDLLR